MTYRIEGLAYAPFAPPFALDDAALAARRARRVIADAALGFPCRLSLADAAPGEEVILVHHVHHDVDTPFRQSHAIHVRRDAAAATYRDRLPPMLARRTVSLRGFAADAMLRSAALAAPGDGEAALATLLADPAIAYADLHNAAFGCFLARVDRA